MQLATLLSAAGLDDFDALANMDADKIVAAVYAAPNRRGAKNNHGTLQNTVTHRGFFTSAWAPMGLFWDPDRVQTMEGHDKLKDLLTTDWLTSQALAGNIATLEAWISFSNDQTKDWHRPDHFAKSMLLKGSTAPSARYNGMNWPMQYVGHSVQHG
jgi:hypothetical protein